MREIVEKMRDSGKQQLALNMVDPGFCISELLREGTWAWYFKVMVAVSNALFARTSEMGSRNYVWAVSAGSQSHGIYTEDCTLSTPAPFADTEEGKLLQTKVLREFSEILDGIAPGIMQNI